MKIQRILGAVLLLTACQRETPLQEIPEPVTAVPVTRLQTVSTRLESDAPDSKSVISVEAEDFRTAYLFAFDANTGRVFLDEDGRNIGLKTESKTFNWTIPVGPDSSGNSQEMDVYAIVNPDPDNAAVLEGLLARADVTEAELEALVYVCGDALSLSRVETDGMPMSGVRKGLTLDSADEAFVLTIKRLFARYDIRLNVQPYAQAGWTVEAAEVIASHSNTRVPYFYTGDGVGVCASAEDLAMVDMATDSDLARLNVMGDDGKSSGYLTLYFLENCQGDIGPANAWNSVFADLGSAVDCCSYAELAVKASHPHLGERCFKYRFYPGQNDDMCSNFDIIRNVRRKLSLTLSPDLSSEYFRWVYDGSLKVAPGEMLIVRYETTLNPQYLCFETYLDGLPDNYLTVQPLNDGRVTVKAAPDTPEGTVFQLKGGDASGQISDKVDITATSEVSFWKDVELLYTPQYRGQWMVVRLPESLFEEQGTLQAGLANYYRADGGSYVPDAGSSCSLTVNPGADAFGNGKTNVRRSHIWYDHATCKLFVYSYFTHIYRDNYSVLTLTWEDGGDILQSKEWIFRQKEPRLRLKTHLTSNTYIYNTTFTLGDSEGKAPSLDLVLVDPDDCNHIIPNQEFLWGGHGVHSMPGMSYAPSGATAGGFYLDNFFVENPVDIECNESVVEDCFELKNDLPDEGSWDFSLYNFRFSPRGTAFSYDEDNYYILSMSYFFDDELHIHPTCQVLSQPVKSVTIMQACGGTNNPAAMQCSATPAGEDFFLMYGFCQTFFVKLENLSGLTVTHDSDNDFHCQLTPAGSTLYRLDIWTSRYDSPLSFDDTALPYSPSQTGPETGDRNNTVTVSSGTYSDSIVCHLLHRRFSIAVEAVNGEDLRLAMWNPLGLEMDASCSFSANFSRYWYRHPLKEHFDGPCFDEQSASFAFSALLGASSILARDVSAQLEKGSQDLRGVRCTYARDVHPSFVETGFSSEDLILYYPAAQAVSFSGNLQLSSNGFSSTVPGLSWREGSFNLEHYIAFSAWPIHLRYTLGTLSEYYLQSLFYDVTDIRYYGYRFATPVHWSESNTLAPFTLTSNAPVHIGGPDSEKTVQGTILYKSAANFHHQDPVIGF